MEQLQVETDPGEVGLDPDRLGRITDLVHGYVDDERLPFALTVLARNGKVAYLDLHGWADREAGQRIEIDSLVRIYSMTKPIAAVAALALWEDGRFELRDPVRRFIPSFRDTRVWRGGTSVAPQTEPLTEDLCVWHLMAHMSGLSYGFFYNHPVDALYRQAGFEWGTAGSSLAEMCDTLASLPLLFQPGREWNYSMGLDVLGRVVEVIAGVPFDQFCKERIFEPLGMVDTAFGTPPNQLHRLAQLYRPGPNRTSLPFEQMGKPARTMASVPLGGGGLVSTARDYHRFVQMLANGGTLDGVRVLGPRTIAMMASNHLPGGADLTAVGRPLFAETTFDGVGFGLGVSVTIDPVKAKVPGSVGDYGWGGAASTTFWVDPVEDLTCVFLTQLLPSSTYPIRSQLKQVVHQALR